jgi:hypothetical protein
VVGTTVVTVIAMMTAVDPRNAARVFQTTSTRVLQPLALTRAKTAAAETGAEAETETIDQIAGTAVITMTAITETETEIETPATAAIQIQIQTQNMAGGIRDEAEAREM